MNKNITEATRKECRGKPANDRLEVIAAKRDQLEGEIQQAYSIIKDAAERQTGFGTVERELEWLSMQKVLH